MPRRAPSSSKSDWGSADAPLAAGDALTAETAYRALLARMGAPLIATAQQVRAIRGLARALSAQGGAKLAEGIALQRGLLDRLVVQSWRGDAVLVALGAEHQAALRAAGQAEAAARVAGLLERYRSGGPPPRF